jgi:hypothetical protein
MKKYQNSTLETVGMNQRNWSEQPVPDHHIEYLVNVAANTPTKQSNRYWNLLVLTNRHMIETVFETTKCWDYHNKTWHYNTQMLAPLIMLWVKTKIDVGNDSYYAESAEDNDDLLDTHQSVGISAGITAYEAAGLGYRIGFCRCFTDTGFALEKIYNHTPFEAKKFRNGNYPGSAICLGLGIGLGKHDDPRANHDNTDTYKPTDKCLPKIYYIK